MANIILPQKNGSDPDLKTRAATLYQYMAKRLCIKAPPKIIFSQDRTNAEDPFGKTAYYDHSNRCVRVYITNRHPTDILRSFAHELIHHWQNEHGALPNQNGGHEHYAQKDPVLRKREMEAYLLGNILFRDWQDENRYGKLNENLGVQRPDLVQRAVKKMLFDLIKQKAITSFHRDLTSGDMDPNDFVEELTRDIILKINNFIQTVDNRGNWENQPNMIKEMSRPELKKLIRERIDAMFKEVNWEDEDNPSKEKISKKTKKHLDTNQSYAQWVKKFIAKKDEQGKRKEKYYEIGPEHITVGGDWKYNDKYFTWYWNPTTQQIIKKQGGSHGYNFGMEAYNNFRGRYDMISNELSITIPHYGKMKITGNMEQDVPPELIDALKKEFNDPKIFYFPFNV